jgi:hypothetical protein
MRLQTVCILCEKYGESLSQNDKDFEMFYVS